MERVRIRPIRGWAGLGLSELWRFHELVYFLIWRDVRVRYKQTLLGAAWAILQPFLTMVIFSIFFGELAGMSSDGFPYPIFSYVGLLPWGFFESGVTKAAGSLVAGRHLITKVYFPRLAIPLASVASGLVDFGLAFVVLIGMMAYYRVAPSPALWGLPLFLLLALSTALGVSLWLSALNVSYRDIGYLLPFLLRAWFFLTPVTYAANLVPEAYRSLYALNPMTGVVEGMRWAMLGDRPFPSELILPSVAVAAVLLVSGLIYFRTTERTFADVV
ncbi:MAG: ABC transporter permease [Anaerolineales bacterium]